jgi:hypothetical protein
MKQPERPEAPETVDIAAAETSVSRRRALLKRLGSGAAIAAAGSPLQALAGSTGNKSCFHRDTPNKKVKASVSGMQSVISSLMAQEWPESKGKHCSYYRSTIAWPKDGTGRPYCRGQNGTRYAKSAKYHEVFGCAGGGTNDKTIEYIMDRQIAPHCNWVTACLNATALGDNFSYTAHEVTALHNDPSKNLDAQYFFKYYQENYYS